MRTPQECHDPMERIREHLVFAIAAASKVFNANLVAVYVVGSQATGTANAASDIDICVVTTGGESEETHAQWYAMLQTDTGVCWLDGCVLQQAELAGGAPVESIGVLLAIADHGRLIWGTEIRDRVQWPGYESVLSCVTLPAIAGLCRMCSVAPADMTTLTALSTQGAIESTWPQASRLSVCGCVSALARAILFLRTGELILTKHKLAAAWQEQGNAEYADWCLASDDFRSYVANLGPEASGKIPIPRQIGEALIHMTQALIAAMT